MKPVFSPAILQDHLQCASCNWEGKGNDALHEKFTHEESIELYCPKCNYYFGFIDTGTQEDLFSDHL